MGVPQQANIRLVNSPEYREGYANSVQVRASVWDFLLVFGRLQQQAATEEDIPEAVRDHTASTGMRTHSALLARDAGAGEHAPPRRPRAQV